MPNKCTLSDACLSFVCYICLTETSLCGVGCNALTHKDRAGCYQWSIQLQFGVDAQLRYNQNYVRLASWRWRLAAGYLYSSKRYQNQSGLLHRSESRAMLTMEKGNSWFCGLFSCCCWKFTVMTQTAFIILPQMTAENTETYTNCWLSPVMYNKSLAFWLEDCLWCMTLQASVSSGSKCGSSSLSPVPASVSRSSPERKHLN